MGCALVLVVVVFVARQSLVRMVGRRVRLLVSFVIAVIAGYTNEGISYTAPHCSLSSYDRGGLTLTLGRWRDCGTHHDCWCNLVEAVRDTE